MSEEKRPDKAIPCEARWVRPGDGNVWRCMLEKGHDGEHFKKDGSRFSDEQAAWPVTSEARCTCRHFEDPRTPLQSRVCISGCAIHDTAKPVSAEDMPEPDSLPEDDEAIAGILDAIGLRGSMIEAAIREAIIHGRRTADRRESVQAKSQGDGSEKP